MSMANAQRAHAHVQIRELNGGRNMAYQTDGSIRDAVDNISSNSYLLPAIQREFVWDAEKICNLFDSIMQKYPIGDFLFWRVQEGAEAPCDFYEFMRDYHERDARHCKEHGPINDRSVTAVLDGQQRLTAFNIGLQGSLSLKIPNKRKDNPKAYPKLFLALNVLSPPDPDEEGRQYMFRFLEDRHIGTPVDDALWFRVSDISRFRGASARDEWLGQHQLSDRQRSLAKNILERLDVVIHERNSIWFYEVKSDSLDKVLHIFVRTNSGGAVLTYSDLLLSMATQKWGEGNARNEVHTLTKDMNEVGNDFQFTKDHVLKAGLMLSGIDVGFKVKNFTDENMKALEGNWDKVRDSLMIATRLLHDFGYDGRSLLSHNAILPIAYYIFKIGATDRYRGSKEYQEDREAIRQWLARSFLKRPSFWGYSSDTLLSQLRDGIDASAQDGFPGRKLELGKRKVRRLDFSQEELDELADMERSDRRIHALLLLLFSHAEFPDGLEIDHIFPKKAFHLSELRQLDISQEEKSQLRDCSGRLGNLQLLDKRTNVQKGDTMPNHWLEEMRPEAMRNRLVQENKLSDVPEDVLGFIEFYEARRKSLREDIGQILGD